MLPAPVPCSGNFHSHLRQAGEGAGSAGQRGAARDSRAEEDPPDGALRLRPRGARREVRRADPGPDRGGGMHA